MAGRALRLAASLSRHLDEAAAALSAGRSDQRHQVGPPPAQQQSRRRRRNGWCVVVRALGASYYMMRVLSKMCVCDLSALLGGVFLRFEGVFLAHFWVF